MEAAGDSLSTPPRSSVLSRAKLFEQKVREAGSKSPLPPLPPKSKVLRASSFQEAPTSETRNNNETSNLERRSSLRFVCKTRPQNPVRIPGVFLGKNEQASTSVEIPVSKLSFELAVEDKENVSHSSEDTADHKPNDVLQESALLVNDKVNMDTISEEEDAAPTIDGKRHVSFKSDVDHIPSNEDLTVSDDNQGGSAFDGSDVKLIVESDDLTEEASNDKASTPDACEDMHVKEEDSVDGKEPDCQVSFNDVGNIPENEDDSVHPEEPGCRMASDAVQNMLVKDVQLIHLEEPGYQMASDAVENILVKDVELIHPEEPRSLMVEDGKGKRKKGKYNKKRGANNLS